MSFLDLPTIVYALWGLYSLFALSYVIGYIRWTIKCVDWYNKIEGVIPRTAQRLYSKVVRAAALLNFSFYATVVTFAVATMVNIIAIENQYVYQVIGIIAAPWIVVGILRLIIGRRASNHDLYPSVLLPRRLALAATSRKETYALGTHK